MIFILVAAGVFALDYAMKEHVNSTWLQGTERKVLGGRVIFRNCHNQGAAFGLLKNADKELCREASVLVLGGVLWEFVRQTLKGGRKIARFGLSMVLGGGLNNYHERRTKGAVTDYVSLGVKNPKTRGMVFNLSDVFIGAGTVLWMISALLPGKKRGGRKVKNK